MGNKMKEMWDSRYASKDYAYGTGPNEFFRDTLVEYNLAGRVLLPAEGEGRNAVFAAKRGMDVTAFDISEEGRKKALALAESQGVEIKYDVGDLPDIPLAAQKFDVVGLIFAHFPPSVLSKYHRALAELLDEGGFLILEGFGKGHLPLREANPGVGGPNRPDMLFSTNFIKDDFSGFEVLKLEEVEVELSEGKFHNGNGSVVRFIGRKAR